MGDMNTRLQLRKDYEEHVMGTFVFGKGEIAMETQAPETAENRELFIELCLEKRISGDQRQI